jgi:hypothetical protein
MRRLQQALRHIGQAIFGQQIGQRERQTTLAPNDICAGNPNKATRPIFGPRLAGVDAQGRRLPVERVRCAYR